MKLHSETVILRALEPSDIDTMYQWENDTDNWFVSNTITPYSRFLLEQFTATAHKDIYENKQLRLIICSPDNKAVGTIDLFDFDPLNQRAGVGILIADKSERRKGLYVFVLKHTLRLQFMSFIAKKCL